MVAAMEAEVEGVVTPLEQIAWMERMQKFAREVGWREAVRIDREEREQREAVHPSPQEAK